MVTGLRCKSLVRVCLVDFFTREVLVNALVLPVLEESQSWVYSRLGIDSTTMKAEREAGRALSGRDEARAELWRFIDADIIIVGNHLAPSLHCLGMIHTRVFDVGLQIQRVVGGAMSTISESFRAIIQEKFLWRTPEATDTFVTDSDWPTSPRITKALSIRELALWCAANPEELAIWGQVRREEHQAILRAAGAASAAQEDMAAMGKEIVQRQKSREGDFRGKQGEQHRDRRR